MSASVAKGRKSYGGASRAAAPAVATLEEIFRDPSDIQLYRSMIGPEGWCVRYDKTTRKCSIYSDSIWNLKKIFDKEACSSCRDTIKAFYGSDSKELDKFNHSVRS